MKIKMTREARVLLYGSNLWYFGEGMFAPLLAVFTEQIGGDIFDITWAWAIYLIVTGLLMIIIGRISDRINKERMMMWGYALNALFTFGYLIVGSPAQLFILQAGLGIAAALATPTWDALYDTYSRGSKNLGNTWGIADGTPPIVTGVAIIIGGYILNTFSFYILFIIMGCIQVLATLYQAQILYKK